MTNARLRSVSTFLAALTLGLSACGPAAPPPAATSAPAAATTAPAAAAAVAPGPAALPADAAPAEQQVYVQAYDSTQDFTTLDFFQSVYGRAGATSDLMTEPLVRLNKN